MIHTFTPNPSVDRAFGVGALAVGQVNRAFEATVDAGGKGINISRALAQHGLRAPAVFPYGGPDGNLLLAMLAELEVAAIPVEVSAATRSNITVSHDSGQTTKINASGSELSPLEVDLLLGALESVIAPQDIVVMAGSLAPGMPSSLYAEVGTRVFQRGGRIVVDTSGPWLQACLDRADLGALWLIKPNLEELEDLTGAHLVTVQDVVEAVGPLLERGLGCALVSLGEFGLLFIDSKTVAWSGGEPLEVVSSVGAGDMTLAGFLFGLGLAQSGDSPAVNDSESLGVALLHAARWGRAAVGLPGTQTPTNADLLRVSASVTLSVSRGTRLEDLPSTHAQGQ